MAILLEGPKHGYALKKQAGLISGQPDMHNNIVYPLLRRFVSRKWVAQRKTAGERGQTRQVYSLTCSGRAALVDRIREFGKGEASSAEAFRLRVGLFEIVDSAAREDILVKRKDFLESRATRLALLNSGMNLGLYGNEIVRFMRQQIHDEMFWIARLRRMNQRVGRKPYRGQGSI